MAARKVQRKATRRKAAEPEEIERDLTDEGNPAELEGPGESGEIIKEEEPFEPKHSMTEAGKAYANMKAIKDYFGEGGEGDLSKMDHPGMREGLKALTEEGGPLDKAMQHVKDLVTEHHGADYKMEPDELMEKLCKSVEHLGGEGSAPYDKDIEPLEPDAPTTEIKDDSFMQGEDNLVDSGAVPEGDLEPLDEEEEEEEEKQHGSDEDTEEILERYQHPKTGQWHTRVIGKAWRAKNGRIYVKSVEHIDGTGSEPYGKDLTDPGNPAEFNTPTDTGAIVKGDVTDEHLDAIGKAAEHLEDAAADDATPKMHKAAHSYHAKALREVHRDLTNEGNPDELEGPHDKDGTSGAVGGSDLTEGVEELKDLDEEEHKVNTRGPGWTELGRAIYSVAMQKGGQWLTAEQIAGQLRGVSADEVIAEAQSCPGLKVSGDKVASKSLRVSQSKAVKEELKDLDEEEHKIEGDECEGGDNDDPECRAMFAAQDRGGKSAKSRAAKALADMNAINAELARKARMYGVNGSRN